MDSFRELMIASPVDGLPDAATVGSCLSGCHWL